MLKMIYTMLVCFMLSFSSWAFTSESLINIDCEVSNGVSIKTFNIDNGVHWVKTNWFGMIKVYMAKFIPAEGNDNLSKIQLSSADQGYVLEGVIDDRDTKQVATFELYARHPIARLKVAKAECKLEFALN